MAKTTMKEKIMSIVLAAVMFVTCFANFSVTHVTAEMTWEQRLDMEGCSKTSVATIEWE